MKQLRELGAVALLTAAIFTPAIIAAQTPAAPPGGGIPDLIGPLKATPGVLGVDAGADDERQAGDLRVVREQTGRAELV